MRIHDVPSAVLVRSPSHLRQVSMSSYRPLAGTHDARRLDPLWERAPKLWNRPSQGHLFPWANGALGLRYSNGVPPLRDGV
jgi:hypothetical protein